MLLPPEGKLVGVLQLLNKDEGFDAFDERLVTAFASHAAIALERAKLLDEAKQSQAMKMNLDVGRQIQTGFLPKQLPTIPGYEIAAWWEPAEGVGGDYYDVLPLPDGRVGLVIADVSGHGIGPSLLMASVRAMLHVLARTESDPSRILSLLSETIRGDFEHGRFVTLLFVVLDPVSHELTWVNAGHGPSLLLERKSGTCKMLETTALPLGFSDDHIFPSAGPLSLATGDLLLLATDGAIELRSEQGEMFGRRRLEEVFLAHQHEAGRSRVRGPEERHSIRLPPKPAARRRNTSGPGAQGKDVVRLRFRGTGRPAKSQASSVHCAPLSAKTDCP